MKKRKILLAAAGVSSLLLMAAFYVLLQSDPEPAPRSVGTEDSRSSDFAPMAADAPTRSRESDGFGTLMRAIHAVYERFGRRALNPEESRQLVLEQASLIFDHKLGAEHPKKKGFMEIAEWSLRAREPIEKEFYAGKLSRAKLFAKLEAHFTEAGERYGALFNEKEYQAVFEMPRSANMAHSMGISRQMAVTLDARDRKIPGNEQLIKEGLNKPETKRKIQALRKAAGIEQ